MYIFSIIKIYICDDGNSFSLLFLGSLLRPMQNTIIDRGINNS